MAEVPAGMFVPTHHTRETACLLKAVDPAMVALSLWRVEAARTAAAGADDRSLNISQRLELRQELARIMDELSGTTWRFGERTVSMQTDREFWLETWEVLHKHAPNDPLFAMYNRDDLIDELGDDEEMT